MPGHLSASTKWTDGRTKLEFNIGDGKMSIRQDGVVLATSRLTGSLAERTAKQDRSKTSNGAPAFTGRMGVLHSKEKSPIRDF